MMEQSRAALNEAHKIQTRLIGDDQGLGKTKVSLVLVHAQDHFNDIYVSQRACHRAYRVT